MKRLFHYTRAGKIQTIISDAEIKVASKYVDSTEKPVAWFSYRQDWEPTATPMHKDRPLDHLSFEEFAELETPVRIEIDPQAAPLDWRTWRKLSGVKSRMAKTLEEIALRQNASVTDWRMSFEPVKIEHWLAIEFFINGQWIDSHKAFTNEPKATP